MQTEYIDYKEGSTTLEGFVAFDAATKTKRPTVIVAHAWGGQDDFARQKAQALAELGYVGFALDVYGKGKRGSTMEENAKLMQPFVDDRALLRRRLLAAVDAVKAHAMVDGNHIGAIGYCFGGLCVLDLARSAARGVRGVVSFHGLFAPPELGAQERITANVLALHGWDDPMATPDAVLAFAREMSGAKADWQLHAYGNTVHAFTNPDANMADKGILYNKDADRRSWQEMVNFFEEVL